MIHPPAFRYGTSSPAGTAEPESEPRRFELFHSNGPYEWLSPDGFDQRSPIINNDSNKLHKINMN
jgi:hypothetical protein